MLSLLALNGLAHAAPIDVPRPVTLTKWVARQEQSTVGNFVSLFNRSYSVVDRGFDEDLAVAYEAFTKKQKRLDPEFSEILAANLWDLYAR